MREHFLDECKRVPHKTKTHTLTYTVRVLNLPLWEMNEKNISL